MGSYLSKNEFPVNGRTALITGGSRGMGLSVGRQLAEKGASVIIVARDVDKLRESIAYIAQGTTSPTAQRFHHISADLHTAPECARVIAEATAWNNNSPPDIVWCCAGSSYPTLFIDTPVDQFQVMMDSNYFTSVYIAHAVLNTWLRPPNRIADGQIPLTKDNDSTSDKPAHTATPSGSNDIKPSFLSSVPSSSTTAPLPRHLIFTASFVSFYTFAGYAPYSPTKAALRSLSDSLSQEMNLYAAANPLHPPVRLHTVFPGTILTASFEAENLIKSDLTRSLEAGDTVLSPEEVARRSIKGLEGGEELVATSWLVRLVGAGMLGGSVRGGWIKGTVDTALSWIVVIVMVFVRRDMDRKVKRWAQEHGMSGNKNL